jgi:hypothetical protein
MRQRRTVTPCQPRRQRGHGTDSVPQQQQQYPFPYYTLSPMQDAPLVPLHALLLSDASPEEIARRLRLNLAIRILLDAIAEREVAS